MERGVLEVLADAIAQLGGGRFGEGDCCEALHLQRAGGDQLDDARDQRRGLAGTGASLDKEGGVQLGAQALARIRDPPAEPRSFV